MYIAVYPYKFKDYPIVDKVLVFDTSDCTVEFVTVKDLKESGVVVRNLSVSWREVMYADLRQYLYEDASEFVHEGNYNWIVIGDKHVAIDDYYSVSAVNYVNSLSRSGVSFVYMFYFKGWLILRCVEQSMPNHWYTFAVKDKTVEQWSEDMEICTNKALAVQVDMTVNF